MHTPAPFCQQLATGMRLVLHIQPGAKKTEIVGLYGDALKIRLAAPPVDGQANAALLRFLAERLGVAKSALRLKSGQSSRRKTVDVLLANLTDSPQQHLEACLTALRHSQ